MLVKLGTLALIVPYVAAFTIDPLVNANGGDQVTISWSATSTDPQIFSIELTNSAFHNTFAVANNVATSLGSVTIYLPQVQPGDGYTVEAVAIDNVNQVYAQSGDFAIGATTTSSDTASATTGSSTAASTTDTAASVTSSSPLSTATGSASSASLSTLSSTGTVPVSSGSSSASAARSSTATSTPSSSSTSGAASFKSISLAPAVALVLSTVAGAAMVF